MIQKIETEKAPKAIGPYSQGWVCNGLVFTSGQLPMEPNTGEIAKGIEAQTNQCCKNVQAVLEAAGCKMDQVIKTTCFIASMDDFPIFNEIYATYFSSKPARSCVAVKTLPKNALCEIEAIAVASYS